MQRESRRRPGVVAATTLVLVAACAGGDAADTTTTGARTTAATTPPAIVTTTEVAPTTTTTTTPTTSTIPTTAAPTTTVALGADDALAVVEIGRSVEGRPIVAVERGTPGGRVVLVIGVIHGDEAAGARVIDRLATAPVPAGVDLWLVRSINPDGQAARTRTNAHQVDLNRNFPYDWAPLGEPDDPEYAGTGPASEPETQAVVDLVTTIRPEVGIWYHQDLYRINPAEGRDGELRARYAELTGLPVLPITGGTYTGVAATWQRRTVDGAVAFIVELGPRLSAAEADRHAAAVLDVATR